MHVDQYVSHGVIATNYGSMCPVRVEDNPRIPDFSCCTAHCTESEAINVLADCWL